MKEITKHSAYNKTHQKRFDKTIHFINQLDLKSRNVLDLGPNNPLSELLKSEGFKVSNTGTKQDLDLDYEIVKSTDFDIVTAFEIFEHMVSPFPLLKSIRAEKLIASVPLKLWFTNAYWNDKDPFDCHYHEFEARQFDMLLEKAGWKIQSSEKWVSKSNQIGFRPFLRRFTPRYYIVYATR